MADRDSSLDVEVTDNPEKSRYEATIDGQLAGFADYRESGDSVVFTHTEVYPRWEGQGVASRIAAFALEAVVASGKQITPACAFIADYIRQHTQYVDDVDDRSRADVTR